MSQTGGAEAREIPEPKGHWLTGHMRPARERPLSYLLEITRQHGDIVKLRLGPQRMVLVNSPEHVKHVLQEKQSRYGRPAFVALMRRAVGNGLLFSEGDVWLRQRRILQPTFHRERIAGFAAIMARAVSERVALWRARERSPLDLTRELEQLTFEIVGRALFASDLSSEARELGDAIVTTLRWLNERTLRPLAAPLFVPTRDNRSYRAAQRTFARTIQRMLDERRHAAADGGDLLSMLLAARDAETGHGMSDRQLRDEVLTFLIAGYETTSAALSWALILLAQHPEVAAKVRAEQRRVCGERPPRPEDLANMRFSRAVIDEVLRLYPPVFGLQRRATEDDTLAGHRIAKGSALLISPYALHRNPTLWRDPDAFDPERFVAEREQPQRSRFAYIPFGAGARQCIGNAFALMELQVLVPTLVAAFDLELDPSADITPDPRMTLRPRGPVTMRVRAL